MHAGCGNPSKNRQATDGADPGAGLHHRDASANAIPGDEASCEVTDIGRDKGHPCKKGNALQAESARIAEVLRQPEDIEPPDGIGECAAENNAPYISIARELKPTPGTTLRGDT